MEDKKRFTVVPGGLNGSDGGQSGASEAKSTKASEKTGFQTRNLFGDMSPISEPATISDSDESIDAGIDEDSDKVSGAEDPEEAEEPAEFDRSSLSCEDYRWAWMEVDLGCIFHNVSECKRRLSPRVRVMAVVKADGYGHGAVQVAKAAALGGATWFGVATVEEALELRDAGFKEHILILSQPPIKSIPLLLEYEIIPSVYETEFAIALGEAAAEKGVVAKYHLAINTGMNRIGVWYTDVVDFLRSLSFHSALDLDGTFTHFATADSTDEYIFRLQLKRFNEALDAMKAASIKPGIVHAAASAATIRFKEAHFDMVRLGIVMYGLHPGPITRNLIELWPAMSIKARITCVTDIKIGEGVGYGMTYQTNGSEYIATIPVGYADGLARRLSNGMSVLYKGRFCRQVGNICMDQFMFSVDKRRTGFNDGVRPEVGDEVIVIGRDGDKVLHLDDMADALKTINYELACRFGMRLSKVYKEISVGRR